MQTGGAQAAPALKQLGDNVDGEGLAKCLSRTDSLPATCGARCGLGRAEVATRAHHCLPGQGTHAVAHQGLGTTKAT